MPPIRSSTKNALPERNAQQLDIKSFFAKEVAKDASTTTTTTTTKPLSIPEEEVCPAAVGALAGPDTPPAVKNVVNAFQALRSASQGEKEVRFNHDGNWEKGWQTKLSSQTKKLVFGSAFVLTDRHIEQLLSIGPGICRSLTHFEFLLEDVSYDAHNANELTHDMTVRLARKCPGLRFVRLQGVSAGKLSDATLIAFLSNCPNLTYVELTGLRAEGIVTEASFDALLEHPSWAPKLKTLRIPRPRADTVKSKKSWEKAMRALSRERERLLIEVTSISQVKKWGDWELDTWHDTFRKGKAASTAWF